MIYAISYGTSDHGNKCKNVQRGLMGMNAVMASDTLWFVDTELTGDEVHKLVAPPQRLQHKNSPYVNVESPLDTFVIRVHRDFGVNKTEESDQIVIDWLRDPQRRW